jgi:hypothetical protein
MLSGITIVLLKSVLQRTDDRESVNESCELYRRHDNQ